MVTDDIRQILASNEAMLFYGLATHFLFEFARMLSDNDPICLIAYLFGTTKHQVQTCISVIGALVGYAALNHTGDLSPITAFGVGYMANTVPDLIGKRVGAKL